MRPCPNCGEYLVLDGKTMARCPNCGFMERLRHTKPELFNINIKKFPVMKPRRRKHPLEWY